MMATRASWFAWPARTLLLAFAGFLALFVALRWDVDAWLAARVQQQAQAAGAELRFRSLGLEGLRVVLRDPVLRAPGMRGRVALDRLEAGVDWASLMRGRPALRLKAAYQGIAIRASLAREDGALACRDLALETDASALEPWLAGLPVRPSLGGHVRAGGELRIDPATGRPLAGRLDVRWREATVAVGGAPVARGEYRIQTSGENGTWQWTAKGGNAPALEAEGTLVAAQGPPSAWRLSGRARVRGGEGVLAALTGNGAEFMISGSLAGPVVRTVGR